MSGVSGDAVMWCPCCQDTTKHFTTWDSGDPKVTDIQCLVCHGPKPVSGLTITNLNGLRRLVKSGHTCQNV
jgi:hypothetical protein